MTPVTSRPSLNGRPAPLPVPAAKQSAAAPTRQPSQPWSVKGAAAFLGISERHLSQLAADGKVRSIRLGARRLIPAEELDRLAREGTG
jgi:excisionase family DNA binding protein